MLRKNRLTTLKTQTNFQNQTEENQTILHTTETEKTDIEKMTLTMEEIPKEIFLKSTDLPPTTLIQIQKTRDMIQAKIIIEGEQTEEEKMKAKTILTKEHAGRDTNMKKISQSQ